MNLILAAGLFDNPWVVAAIILGGALVNWLSQRRQAKQQEQEGKPESTPLPKKAPGEFDMEETLRRLLGEEVAPPELAPPPIPRSATMPPARPPRRQEVSSTPVLVPPPVAMALPVGDVLEPAEVETEAAARLAAIDEQVRQHQVQIGRSRRAPRKKWSGVWRGRADVRRAFVGSLVFGPPKGLES